ncbi:hypothetical protein AMS68_003745 [Peltaster fructicola]|uniref:Oxidoreductase NAD-binding domain-containing protein 1 n=1 Tax=Peltaster fructicola TaxID=286661 RepID=A0A6H0XUD4_9PEZI|nr:hypothetical protein AMS68_003745 [Peltaster fructicola]
MMPFGYRWTAIRTPSSRTLRTAIRSMATVNHGSIPHEQRTAFEPRERLFERVTIANIREINDTVRLLRLNTEEPNRTINFLPGQWLDVFIPGLPQAGGFTITSTPFSSRPSSHSHLYLELAIQKSRNPPARWLWQPEADILGTILNVRVGGSFHWPPPMDISNIDRLVLVAGGVGINPLVSIMTFLIQVPVQQRPREIHFLYASKTSSELDAQKILFLPRLLDLVGIADDPLNVTLSLYLTGSGTDEGGLIEDGRLPNRTFARRLQEFDLSRALDGFRDGGMTDRKDTVAYVCGPPKMTDEIVATLNRQEGMSPDRVLCEKWW